MKVGEKRRHIHFATQVGIHLRDDAEVALWLDLRGAIRSGIPFDRAKNGVIVTAGVDGRVGPDFFLGFTDLHSRSDLQDIALRKIFTQLPCFADPLL